MSAPSNEAAHLHSPREPKIIAGMVLSITLLCPRFEFSGDACKTATAWARDLLGRPCRMLSRHASWPSPPTLRCLPSWPPPGPDNCSVGLVGCHASRPSRMTKGRRPLPGRLRGDREGKRALSTGRDTKKRGNQATCCYLALRRESASRRGERRLRHTGKQHGVQHTKQPTQNTIANTTYQRLTGGLRSALRRICPRPNLARSSYGAS